MHSLSRAFRLAALLLLAACVSAPAVQAQYFGRNKVQYDDFEFRTFDTEQFEIYFYPEEEVAAKDAGRMAERWYTRHSQTFLRQFQEKKPLIFYANDADFQQTNTIGGRIGQGTGGVTESLKERVIMPFTGSYAENDHVLGHELVHSFQYDIGLRNRDSGFQLQRLPLWLVEGMAEYLSVGRADPHTAMWLRDAVLRKDLPTIDDLTRSRRYFPYRYGQAYMAYVGGKYGDPAVANLFKLAGRVGVDSAFVYALGITTDSLSKEWQAAVRDTYTPLMEGRTPPAEAGRILLGDPEARSELNVSPSISPDGNFVAFIAQRNIFTINLYIANAETGEVIQELQGARADPHFDALRFINSAGSWSPDGEKFAFVTFVQGDNEINIIDVESGEIEQRIGVEGVGAITNPSWSPDGEAIAFSGLDGGLSDLYLLDLASKEVRQLTSDRYADLQPTWSPDGQTLAFATDRGPDGTNFETLNFAPLRLGLVDVESGEIDVVRPFPGATHYNPAFAPDGENLYFIADETGFKDIYRYNLTERQAYQVTNLKTGVSGISNTSPAMSIAAQSGRLAFSVFVNGGYTVLAREAEMDADEAVEPIRGGVATAGLLPPIRAVSEGLVGSYLADPLLGLPEETAFDAEDYDASLRLDYVAPPTAGIGVSTGGAFGTRAGLAGGVGLFFSDMLGNHNLTVVLQANGTFKDIGGQVAYFNLKNRYNYGGAVSHVPLLTGGFTRPFPVTFPSGQTEFVQALIRQRFFISQASAVAAYPFTTTRRFEIDAGVIRYGFDRDIDLFLSRTGQRLPEGLIDPSILGFQEEPSPVYFFAPGAAYVGDFSYFGFTSPVQGGRYRFGVSPRVGSFSYVQALADYRRYFFFDPLTFAVRALHIGNYGADGLAQGGGGQSGIFSEARFTQEYLGSPYYPGFVRGYAFSSLGLEDQGNTVRLQGTRIGLASAELRFPFLGVEEFGLINFPYLPTELTLFADAGVAWTGDSLPVLKFVTDAERLNTFERNDNGTPEDFTDDFVDVERYPVFSVGTSARVNLLGAIIFEAFLAYPFQRPDHGWDLGLTLTPGW